jgi:hypothetical protein
MEGFEKVVIEFSLREANVLCNILASSTPTKEDEMISFLLYARIKRKVEDSQNGKNEPL